MAVWEVNPWEFPDCSYYLYKPNKWEMQRLQRLKEIPIYELSKLTGINQGNLTLYLTRKCKPKDENIEKIRQGLFRVNEGDEWKDIILPRLNKTPTCEVVRLLS
jgi:hypothetical protein